MPQSIRSILGKSNRVKKPSRSNTPRQSPRGQSSSRGARSEARNGGDKDQFPERLTDLGITKILQEDLTLRDVVQAMRYIRSKMFSPVPRTGLHSTRTTEILNYRLAVPPIVTMGHLNAILNSPSRVEREVVELWGEGILRKVRVERRAGMGEALIESSDLEAMIHKANLSQETTEGFLEYLKGNPTVQTVSKGALTGAQTDELIRAGFLTSPLHATPGSTFSIRPEDRATLTSIHHVSQFASGTISAVGGQNVIHLAGGGGGASTLTGHFYDSSGFRIALPGHGSYLKLAGGAVDWLREALGKTKWGEGPESWFRERFEGGGLYGTRWKGFWGVEWEWVLGQAVGLGIVEVFDTGSVGRGIRMAHRSNNSKELSPSHRQSNSLRGDPDIHINLEAVNLPAGNCMDIAGHLSKKALVSAGVREAV
ncbi:hypothetical protein PT974_09098 [Cladobotryum mycophilum]|uniref:Serine-threonine protein kinase 19-domain-containing protein n=1 Tax=Cladobotryum mycophilum TaxID=491253 RepID=A0ABR0SGB9_9HYPO